MTNHELRARFPVTEHSVYMDHAAVSPISLGVQAAMLRHATIQANYVMNARNHCETTYRELREAIARLLDAKAENVAFIQNTSHGLSLLANGQRWMPGDNVIVPALEFPSNFLVWKRLEAIGVECRTVPLSEGRITPDVLLPAIDSRTRMIALSAVQYFNGFRCDLAAISDLASSMNLRLVVDGTQSIGAVKTSFRESPLDALVVSAHKWMLGPLGVGFMVLSDEMLRATEVTQIGWLSVNEPFEFRRELDLLDTAQRFESGTENAAGLFGLHARLGEIEEFGALELERRILELTDTLAEKLLGLSCEITSPMESGARSGILTFKSPRMDSTAAVEELKARRVFVSARHGSVRASPHYYNNADEIDEVVEGISAVLSRGSE